MSRRRGRSDPESGLEHVIGIVALLFWSAILIEILGITIIVGVTEIEPRQAALLMLAPTLVVWVAASTQQRLRELALLFFPPYP